MAAHTKKGVSHEGTSLNAFHTRLLRRYVYHAVHIEVTKAIKQSQNIGWGIFHQTMTRHAKIRRY